LGRGKRARGGRQKREGPTGGVDTLKKASVQFSLKNERKKLKIKFSNRGGDGGKKRKGMIKKSETPQERSEVP